MRLKALIDNIDLINIINPDYNIDISGITSDSRKVKKGCAFVAVRGFKKDGHDFAAEAARAGSIVIFSDHVLEVPPEVIQVIVANTRKVLPVISKNFYGDPSKKIILTGVTGTNGKTTTVFLTDSIFRNMGMKTGYITTIQARIDKKTLSFDRTTPDSLELNNFFAECLEAGVQSAAMEISSHSIDLHRVDLLDFDFFVFTNLTQDHLDYHENMENYFGVKARLFMKEYRNLFNGRSAIINIDDEYGHRISGLTDLDTVTFGIDNTSASIYARNIKNSFEGIEMEMISGKTKKIFKMRSSLCGFFNVYNILASIGAGVAAGFKIKDMLEAIGSIHGATGRFEKILTKKGINVIVDYAHTPDGLENVLRTSRSLLGGKGRLISVFGCGGDRDSKKRNIMGMISAGLADISIITSDNPRSEDPLLIMKMIEEGFKETGNNDYFLEPDRKKAIIKALEIAGHEDILLIAGKGHENYQEFADRKIHFSDQEIVREWDRQ